MESSGNSAVLTSLSCLIREKKKWQPHTEFLTCARGLARGFTFENEEKQIKKTCGDLSGQLMDNDASGSVARLNACLFII